MKNQLVSLQVAVACNNLPRTAAVVRRPRGSGWLGTQSANGIASVQQPVLHQARC